MKVGTQNAGALRIALVKRTDGSSLLRCTRADGSVAWQRQQGKQATYFPLHDLIHFAVESTLRARQAFFGLVADGWEFAETEGASARGPVPLEAMFVEHMVALLQAERAGGAPPLSAADFNGVMRDQMAVAKLQPPREVSDSDLRRIRAAIGELHSQWAALPAGETLELLLVRN